LARLTTSIPAGGERLRRLGSALVPVPLLAGIRLVGRGLAPGQRALVIGDDEIRIRPQVLYGRQRIAGAVAVKDVLGGSAQQRIAEKRQSCRHRTRPCRV